MKEPTLALLVGSIRLAATVFVLCIAASMASLTYLGYSTLILPQIEQERILMDATRAAYMKAVNDGSITVRELSDGNPGNK